MYETLKMMSSIITPQSDSMSTNELAKSYRKDKNPITLATIYKRVFPVIVNVSNHYFNLTNSDLASYSLEELDRCLLIYDTERDFAPFFATCFSNRLLKEVRIFTLQKHKANVNTDNLDNCFEIGVYDNYNTLVLPEKRLTEREKKCCKMFSLGYTPTDVAEYLGIHRQAITYLKNSLKIKLKCLQSD